MNIKDKKAVVTGASKGIGFAISKALLETGVQVAGWSRTKPEIDHPNFHFIEVDLTSEASVNSAYAQTREQIGNDISILINNAGLGYRGSFEEMEAKDWKYLFDLNVHGIFYVTKNIVPQMKKQEAGHIINISSGAGTNGIAGMVAYCGTKHAVVGISHSLHAELRDFGIKVTCLSPGSVKTHFSESAGQGPNTKNSILPEDIAGSVIHALQTSDNYHYLDMEVRPLQPNKKE